MTAVPPAAAPSPSASPSSSSAEIPRKVLFVAGAGRSGTSTLSGIVQRLGLHVPQPEVVPDETNPKGFGEPQWVVDLHNRLLDSIAVAVSDARPAAWSQTAVVAADDERRAAAAQWLEGHFAEGTELVVKDPRLSWFLEMWRDAALRTDATPVFATMLRPPAEVVGSKQKYYDSPLGAAHLAASWVNMLLHTELATRTDADSRASAGARVFVRYADLLDDWRGTTMHVGETLGIEHVRRATSQELAAVEGFVDPSLRRVTVRLEELELPSRLHELTAHTWEELNKLADPGGDTPAVHAALDELRAAYVALYDESAAISRSSAVASAEIARRRASRPPAPRGIVDRVPHRVRAAIPPSVRRGVRRALRRPRP
ncbi:sulfotransferase family protein [Nocardioides pacificus]